MPDCTGGSRNLSAPFKSLGHALSFFNECNPARYKALNIFEPERGSRPQYDDFSGLSPRDLWAGVCFSIGYVLKRRAPHEIEAWRLRNIGPREKHLHADDIADKVHMSRSWVYRTLSEINDDLVTELESRGYLEESKF